MTEGPFTPGYVWLGMKTEDAKARRTLLGRVARIVGEASRHCDDAVIGLEMVEMRFALADFEEALDGAIEVAG